MDLATLIASTLQARARQLRLVSYVARQAALGRTLTQALEDSYVVSRTSEDDRRRLAQDPALVTAWQGALERTPGASGGRTVWGLVAAPALADPDEPRRILVIANETAGTEAVLEEVRYRCGDGAAEVLMVAPALPAGTRHPESDLAFARAQAEARLNAAVAALAEVGVAARCEVGPVDPLVALDQALGRFDADEVIIGTNPHKRSRWLRQRVVQQARERYALPVTHLVADLEFERWDDEVRARAERWPDPTARDLGVLDDPDASFDYDGPPEAIDAAQFGQSEVVERDKRWVDWRERMGGED
jgi:hypothetical protein